MAGLADLAAAGISVTVDPDDDAPTVEPDEDGTVEIPQADGGVVVSFNPARECEDASAFDANLADRLPDHRLSEIAETLIEQIEADKKSRSEWMETRAAAIELLGLRLEQAVGDVAASSAPIEGQSTIRDPLLLEAVLTAKATASGELLPSSGPVKVKNDGQETGPQDERAALLEKGLNHWLTSVAKEYYPDTRRMLFWVPFGGSGFKKGYHCPLRRRPVIESVDAKNVIIDAEATDVQTAARVTHEITMRPSVMRRMQVLGAYRDIPLAPPSRAQKSGAQEAEERVSGQRTGDERPEDTPYTLWESYCEIDINEFAPRQFKNKKLPLPYCLTLDTDSRQVLAIRRDWDEDDKLAMRIRTWVKYPYIDALGIYGLGLMHILGNTTMGLTMAEREALDAGMFASFPGLLVARWAARQQTPDIRVPPGTAAVIDTGDRPIDQAVMKMPYGDVTPGLMALTDKLEAKGRRLAGTTELKVGEGRQDAPVGTTIAMIEQATKVETDVHKGLHQAQAEEFEILKRLLREDPGAFLDHCRSLNLGWDQDQFIAALDDCLLVPQADPNTPSHIHRLLKAMALKQLQAGNPALYNAREVDRRVLRLMRIDDPDSLFAPDPPPTAPPPDPKLITAEARAQDAQTHAREADIKAQQVGAQSTERMAELQAESDIEDKRIAKELVIHSDDHGLAERQHGLDVSGHGLDIAAAQHDALMDRAGHALDVHQAMQPPEAAGP